MTRDAARRRLREALGEFARQLPEPWLDAAVADLALYTDPGAISRHVAGYVQAAAELVWKLRLRECAERAATVSRHG